MPTYPNILSSVTLERQGTPDTESDRHDVQSHYIQITAKPANEGDDAAIFVHRMEVQDPHTVPLIRAASFERVCSPSDYNELPVGPPGEEDNYVEFRSTTIKHYARSLEEVEALYDFVAHDVSAMLDAFKRAEDYLTDPEETTFSA